MVFKVKINPVNLGNWTTSTNYSVFVGKGFVSEVGGNKSLSPAQTMTNTVTTFSSVPPTNVYNPPYNTITRYPIVTINYDRGILYNSTNTTNYYLYQGSTLVQTIPSTSTRVTLVNGSVKLDLRNYITTGTSYNIRADQGVIRDMFAFKPNAISNDSAIKFTTSASYITLVPDNTYSFTYPESQNRHALATSISSNYFAVGCPTFPYQNTNPALYTTSSSVSVYSNTGTFLYKISNPASENYKFGIDVSVGTSTLVVSSIDSINEYNTTSTLYVYNISNSSATLSATINNPNPGVEQGRIFGLKVAHYGNYIVTYSRNNVWLYSTSGGSYLRAHTFDNFNGIGGSAVGMLNNYPLNIVAINSTSYAYYDPDPGGTSDHRIRVFDIATGNSVWSKIVVSSADTTARLSIAMNNTYLIVGDIIANTAYVYNASNGNLVYTFTSPDPVPRKFGTCVDVSSQYFIVTDPDSGFEEDTGTLPHGKIFVYGISDGLLKYIIDNPYRWDPASATISYDFAPSAAINSSTVVASIPYAAPTAADINSLTTGFAHRFVIP
jgi:hypothetical protein